MDTNIVHIATALKAVVTLLFLFNAINSMKRKDLDAFYGWLCAFIFALDGLVKWFCTTKLFINFG